MTGQVYAAEGERTLAEQIDRNLPKPYDWVEEATDGGSVVVIGQQISDATGHLAHRVLQPVGAQDVVARRNRVRRSGARS